VYRRHPAFRPLFSPPSAAKEISGRSPRTPIVGWIVRRLHFASRYYVLATTCSSTNMRCWIAGRLWRLLTGSGSP
jgi:hypothetical protein